MLNSFNSPKGINLCHIITSIYLPALYTSIVLSANRIARPKSYVNNKTHPFWNTHMTFALSPSAHPGRTDVNIISAMVTRLL